ncbi:MAG: lipoyl(octanoyl) transferase LipB [Cytophagales bacterium]|nr:lipoyl(octanoyl) transferase LipB [Cytophagales bacterium]
MNPVINKKVRFLPWGKVGYEEAWNRQEELFKGTVDIKIANRKRSAQEQEATPNYLVFCQHPHVYTLGKSGNQNHLLLNSAQLKDKNIEYFPINRGGDITYHGPGQLVAYPLLDLENFFTDIHKYLRLLEEAVILTCADYGLEAGRIDGLTGVWLDFKEKKNPRKICAMGVKTSRWVTMHGLALNVNTDLSYFGNIVPCGITDKAVTSLKQELGREIDFREAEERLKGHIKELFEMELAEEEINA